MTKITIGQTAGKLLDILKGNLPSGASISQSFPGLVHGNGCQYLRIEADTGIVYIGNDSLVSSSNRGAHADAASAVRLFERESGNGYNNIPLNIWIIGNAPSQLIRVTFQYA